MLAREDGEPVGWLAVGPRPSYPRLVGSEVLVRVSGADMDDESVWSTTCFVVKVGHRRRGTSAAAGRWHQDGTGHGATVLEGHPVDLATAATSPGSANLYHGVASVFRRAGFREVGRTGPNRPVLRLAL